MVPIAPSAPRRPVHRRPIWILIAGIALLAALASSWPAAARVSIDPPTATAMPAPCVDFVYPLSFHSVSLEAFPSHWYAPVTLDSLGLSADTDAANIPGLNTTNPQSPRFRVQPNDPYWGRNLYWVRWNGANQNNSSFDLAAAMTGAGTLGLGFSESPPPAYDSNAFALINGTLEIGDWLAAATPISSSAMALALNNLIEQKTLLVLPVYDLLNGVGNAPGSGVRVIRFVQVRLLDYTLGQAGYVEFALVRNPRLCAAGQPAATPTAMPESTPVPITPTATASASPAPTSAANPTATSGIMTRSYLPRVVR